MMLDTYSSLSTSTNRSKSSMEVSMQAIVELMLVVFISAESSKLDATFLHFGGFLEIQQHFVVESLRVSGIVDIRIDTVKRVLILFLEELDEISDCGWFVGLGVAHCN